MFKCSLDFRLWALCYCFCNCIDLWEANWRIHILTKRNEISPHQSLESHSMPMFPVLRLRCITGKVNSTNEVDIYCVCRIPEFTNSQWIQCSTCKEWYHSNICVKVSEKYLNSKLTGTVLSVITIRIHNCKCTNNHQSYFAIQNVFWLAAERN